MARTSRIRSAVSIPLIAALVGLTAPAYAGYTTNFLNLWNDEMGGMRAVGINNNGQIAVSHQIQDIDAQVVNWKVGQAPTITYPLSYRTGNPGESTWIALSDINNKGDVSGHLYLSESFCGSGCSHPFITQGSNFIQFAPPDTEGMVSALNDNGMAVGRLQGPDDTAYRSVLIQSNGSFSYLNSLSGVADINNAGVVAGDSKVGGNTRATLWQNGSTQTLDTLGGSNSFADALNESGQVVGRAQAANGAYHGVLWDSGVITDLGMSAATAINEHGEVVGTALDNLGNSFAAMWKNGTLIDLNTFLSAQLKSDGWSLLSAADINDKGWIVGLASDGNSNLMPFLIATSVPEPGAYLMLLAGLGLIALARRRAGQAPATSFAI